MSNISMADKLSIFPGTQQIVGVGTVVSNVGKLIKDVAVSVNNYVRKCQINYLESKLSEQEAESVDDYLFNGLNSELKPKTSNWKMRQCTKLKEAQLAQGEAKFAEHMKYVFIGLGRATPILGTALSIYRCFSSDIQAKKCEADDYNKLMKEIKM